MITVEINPLHKFDLLMNNSATIEKLGNHCGHDSNYSKDVYIRTKLLKVLNLKPKLFLTLMSKFKKFRATYNTIFFHKTKVNIGREKYNEKKTLSFGWVYVIFSILRIYCIY